MAKCAAVLPLLILLAFAQVRARGVISTYWGQNPREGSLREACETGHYGIINLAFLSQFGGGRTPCIDLAGVCPEYCSVSCTNQANDIKFCQGKGIKVFLSLGGLSGSYGLSSKEDAKQVAEYLWENVLAGQSGGSGILGDVQLDGIDFDIEGGRTLYWDDLIRYLSEYNKDEKKIYLSVSPQCPYPDYRMGKAIDTGLFDYIWVKFFNNHPCQYSNGDVSRLLNSWNEWTTRVKAGSFFLGLAASPSAAPSGGYIPPQILKTSVLPVVKRSEKYGGVMMWGRYIDSLTNYSGQIIDDVFTPDAEHQRNKYSSATLEYFSAI